VDANGKESWESAVLSFDMNSAENRVSQKLLAEVLALPIHLHKEGRSSTARHKIGRSVDGNRDQYIQLRWCTGQDTKKIRKNQFYLSSEYDPPFDVVLGKKDTTKLDL
jgi:hypothetical protein